MNRLIWLLTLLLTVVATPPAHALSEVEAKAEHVRLAEDMKRLAARNAWRGVEEAYGKMEALEKDGVTLSHRDHMLGAEAARALGDINKVYARLRRAVRQKPSAEAIAWLADVDGQYGSTSLKVDPRYPVEVQLVPDEMPFAPDQRAAIENAQRLLDDKRAYEGLLPGGSYALADVAFEIIPGGEPVELVLVAPQGRRATKDVTGVGLIQYVGPRIDVGFAMTQATEPKELTVEPGGFLGSGFRAGLGVEMGLGAYAGMVAQVGYHAMRTSEGDNVEGLHLGYGWLAGTGSFGRVQVLAGPIFSVGGGTVTGISESCADAVAEGGCSDSLLDDPEALEIQELNGSVRAGGGAMGVNVTFKQIRWMRPGITFMGGLQSDGSRMYPWGQAALTLAPGPRGAGL